MRPTRAARKGNEPETRLGRLLKEILATSEDSRRISLTATPVELSPDQWTSLLDRTGIRDTDSRYTPLRRAILDFTASLTRAQTRPDEADALDRLATDSRGFQGALSPFVTRRRRINQTEMKELLPAGLTGAHPHRRLEVCSIEIGQLSNDWRKMVLALEAQGLASKGVGKLALASKQTDIRYSSGLECEFDLATHLDSEPVDRKEQRVLAWAALQKRQSERLTSQTGQWLWSHPRIVHAANRLEELCQFEGTNPTEKVLVFGKFTAPMQALVHTLNARHILRVLDHDQLALLPKLAGEMPALLYYLYQQQHLEGLFVGRLKGKKLTKAQLREMVQAARTRYQNAGDRLRYRLNERNLDWIANRTGGPALLRLRSESQGVSNRSWS